MNAAPQLKRNAFGTLWVAVRFVLFGVGGFVLLTTSWIALLIWFDGDRWMNPLVALPLAVTGAVMMLIGSGQWGRWAYLWVFLSMPIAISLVLLGSKVLARLVPNGGPGPDFIDPKLLGMLVFAAPMPVSYFLVKRYYRRKDARLATDAISISSYAEKGHA